MSAPGERVPPLVAALVRVLAGEEAARLVTEVLRAHPAWNQAERGTAARRLFATALLRARLRYRARLSGREQYSLGDCHSLGDEYSLGEARGHGAPGEPSPRPAPVDAALLLAAYLLDEEQARDDVVRAQTALDAAAAAALRARLASAPPWPTEPAARLSVERSYPRWLADLWVEELGAAAADALAAQTNLPGPLTVRANPRRVHSREALAEELARAGVVSSPARFSPWALHLHGRVNVFGSEAWRRGAFEVQDEGSQLVALACAVRPGERVVDYCAGAGGKTLALAALAGEGGLVCACDVDGRRLGDLRTRLRRAGLAAQEVLLPLERPSRSLAEHLGEQGGEGQGAAPGDGLGGGPPGGVAALLAWRAAADVVLVDAPCSSLGTLRRGPDVRWRLDPASLQGFAPLQRQLLAEATALVRPGGRLVYATCTLRRAENEDVAQGFSAEAAPHGFVPLRLDALLGAGLAAALGAGETLTLRPELHGTDGFFLAAWLRDS